jgi:UDP-N-acetylglucosamine acyltransferase
MSVKNYQAHPLSVVHPEAIIGEGVVIEPFTTIGKDVEIGAGTWIGSNVCIMDGARIGKNCKIFPGAIISAIPQDLKYRGETTTLEIGDNTIIREYCTLNKGTVALGKTIIGSNCLLMAYVHVAHDCVIKDHCILANNVNLAGHIIIDEYAILGGLVAVHQFVHIGAHTMIGGASLVKKDVPPFIKVAREPLSYAGVNSIGLTRRGFQSSQVEAIKDIYRILFVKGMNVRQARKEIALLLPESQEKEIILKFVADSCSVQGRGLIRGFQTVSGKKALAEVAE